MCAHKPETPAGREALASAGSLGITSHKACHCPQRVEMEEVGLHLAPEEEASIRHTPSAAFHPRPRTCSTPNLACASTWSLPPSLVSVTLTVDAGVAARTSAHCHAHMDMQTAQSPAGGPAGPGSTLGKGWGTGGVFSSNTHLVSLPRLSLRPSAALGQLPLNTADTQQCGCRSSHGA